MSADAFGQWLKQRRKALDLTQDELARQVGCATSMLQKIEAGDRRPSAQMARSLARKLGIASEQYAAFVEFARSGHRATAGASFHSPGNLAAPATPLIGRAHDVAAVCRRLMHEDTRLLTLVGPPGIGKTRLALQVAAEARDRFDDGVFFVALAPIADPDLVAPTIVQTLGLTESSRQSPVDRLSEYLRDKLVLLVLDNLEQVVTAAPTIARLLIACPWLKILATSRTALRVRAERQYHVPPLGLPDLARLPRSLELAQYPALALFVERAQAVQPDFSLTETNAATVARLCHRLDGLPLAIELVAARVRLLPPAEILRRLGGRFLLQSDGLRDIDERQRTLQNAIEWSYNLLTPEEQALFARLAVFVGGWSLEAAEYVCAGQVLDSVTALVNKSLAASYVQDGEARVKMLETIREYALARLDAEQNGAAEIARRRHAEYYLTLAEAAEPHLHDTLQRQWGDRLERELGNLRAALEWCLAEPSAMEARLRLAGALGLFWYRRAHAEEGRQWLERVLAGARGIVQTDGPTRFALANAYTAAGRVALFQGDAQAARSYAEQAVSLCRQTGDRWRLCHALQLLADTLTDWGDYANAHNTISECLGLAQETGDPWLCGRALMLLGELAHLQGDDAQAMSRYSESRAMLRQAGDEGNVAIVLHDMGLVAQRQGDVARARELYLEALQLVRETSPLRVIAMSLENLAGVAGAQGQPARSARLLGAAEALRRAAGCPIVGADRFDYERFIAAARAGLDGESFAAAWAQGRAMTMEQAIVYALE